jgi:serine-type D-Ala-D-Ala carboxypeptidase (penicillin-binding protein 5/6)
MRRRYRRRRIVAAIVIMAIGGAGGAALSLALDHNDSAGPDGRPSAAVAQPPNTLRPPSMPSGGTAPAGPPGISFTGPPAHVRFKKPPRAGLILDVDTGRVLWSRKPLAILPIASLTKIMTALIVVEKTSPGAHARIGKNATQFRGSGVGVLPRGKSVPVEGLLYGLLLPSGNDAGVALAERISGSDGRFARLMTQRAQELGLTCTRYVSSYGLQAGNRSCAADLAALTRLAMRQPRITRIVRNAHASVPFPIKGKRLEVSTTNPLLKAHYPGTIGLKTGFTNRAGHCLVAVVRRGGHTVAAVLLHSPNTAAQGKRMIEAGLRALAREDAG